MYYASKRPNKRIMILRDDGVVESASDESECESMSALEDASDIEYFVNDESLDI
jgi:hypothetical protein